MYVVHFSEDAQKDVILLQKHAPKLLPKLYRLVDELKEHPRSGTGKVEQLKHYPNETWSRRLNREHRMVYEIYDNEVLVVVLSSYGHYE